VPWTEPATSETVTRLGEEGARALLLVPVSFVFEHMGTLNEMDRELADVAAQAGVRSFVRVPTLGTEPEFIDSLASVVQEALPDLNQPSMQVRSSAHSPQIIFQHTQPNTASAIASAAKHQPSSLRSCIASHISSKIERRGGVS